jgi:hypothetical protein
MQSIVKKVNSTYLLLAGLLLVSLLASTLGSISSANAASFTTRSLSLSRNTNAGSTATTTYSFSVTVPSTGTTGLRGVEINFCTTPLTGSCTGPTGMSVTSATIGTTSPASGGTLTSSDNATANTALASSNTNTRQVRFQWASNQTLTLPQTVTFDIANIQNPTTAGTFFARIGFFGNGDTTYTTVTDSGTVAQSVQAATNVSFKVQEILQVCAGATTVDDSVTTLAGSGGGTVAGDTCDSVGVAGYLTAVDLGVADPTLVRVSPVASGGTTQGNATNGIVMVRTNASGGATIRYRVIQDNSSGDLKVAGATTCTLSGGRSTVATDVCINSTDLTQADGTGSAIVAGTEEFGMSASYVNRTAGGTTTAVSADANYDGTGTSGGSCTAATGVNCWTWGYDGSADTIGSSSGPIDDEALILKFAAAAALTTPTGLYQVNMDTFAVATY